MVSCGTCESDWSLLEQLALSYPEIIPFYGVHPWYMSGLSDDWLNRLEAFVCKPGAGLGEIGLDHAIADRCDARQEEVFVAQLKLANRLRKPVNVHCRKAWGAILKCLKQLGGLAVPGVLHSYSGSVELIPAFIEHGFYLSFSGAIVSERNRRGRMALATVPRDRFLLETDSPDLLPYGVSGEFNEPANNVHVAHVASEILGMSFEETVKLSFENAQRVFSDLSSPVL